MSYGERNRKASLRTILGVLINRPFGSSRDGEVDNSYLIRLVVSGDVGAILKGAIHCFRNVKLRGRMRGFYISGGVVVIGYFIHSVSRATVRINGITDVLTTSLDLIMKSAVLYHDLLRSVSPMWENVIEAGDVEVSTVNGGCGGPQGLCIAV